MDPQSLRTLFETATTLLLLLDVAAKFARHINELPKERLAGNTTKLTTQALEALCVGDLEYRISRRRRSEA